MIAALDFNDVERPPDRNTEEINAVSVALTAFRLQTKLLLNPRAYARFRPVEHPCGVNEPRIFFEVLGNDAAFFCVFVVHLFQRINGRQVAVNDLKQRNGRSHLHF